MSVRTCLYVNKQTYRHGNLRKRSVYTILREANTAISLGQGERATLAHVYTNTHTVHMDISYVTTMVTRTSMHLAIAIQSILSYLGLQRLSCFAVNKNKGIAYKTLLSTPSYYPRINTENVQWQGLQLNGKACLARFIQVMKVESMFSNGYMQTFSRKPWLNRLSVDYAWKFSNQVPVKNVTI